MLGRVDGTVIYRGDGEVGSVPPLVVVWSPHPWKCGSLPFPLVWRVPLVPLGCINWARGSPVLVRTGRSMWRRRLRHRQRWRAGADIAADGIWWTSASDGVLDVLVGGERGPLTLSCLLARWRCARPRVGPVLLVRRRWALVDFLMQRHHGAARCYLASAAIVVRLVNGGSVSVDDDSQRGCLHCRAQCNSS